MIVALIFISIFTLAGAYGTYSTLNKYLLIKNTAPQTIRSVSQGFAQLHGRAEPIAPINAPIGKIPVVAFRLEIYQYVSSGSGKDRRTRKKTILDITHAPPFVLRDDTGAILIDAPNERTLFTMLEPAYSKRYTISRGGFFDAITKAFDQSRSMFQIRMLQTQYTRARFAYFKTKDYAPVQEAIGTIVAQLQEHLDAFEEARERGGFTMTSGKLFVTEKAILPDETLTVLGSVTNKDSQPIVTRGQDGTFLIGSGDEAQVLKRFRGPFIISIIVLTLSIIMLAAFMLAAYFLPGGFP